MPAKREAEYDWHEHYMNIDAEHLALEYLSRSFRESRNVTPAIEEAVAKRLPEISDALGQFRCPDCDEPLQDGPPDIPASKFCGNCGEVL